MADILRKLQLTQLEMLKVVDAICRKHDIKYSLYAGTLLGAVRHKGFIPWDDDLDICMPRADYDKFIRVWDEEVHDGYILQNKENTPAFTQSFTKIRKDKTAFVQADWEVGKYHTGIFIDIFPIDRMPQGKLARYLFYWRCMRYQLYTREFVPNDNGGLMKFGSKVILALVPGSKRSVKRAKLLKKITGKNDNHSLSTVAIEIFKTMRVPLASTLLDEWTEIQFEDGIFSCFSLWDEYLTLKFGDYMKYPPIEEQTWKHHPICLDFEKNYEEVEG